MLKHGRYGEAIKTARAKLAERFGAYNGHPYPFMLLPPNFPPVLRRGRPYNTDACIEFTKKRKKERERKRKEIRISLDIRQSSFYEPLFIYRSCDTCTLSRIVYCREKKRERKGVRKQKKKPRMYAPRESSINT